MEIGKQRCFQRLSAWPEPVATWFFANINPKDGGEAEHPHHQPSFDLFVRCQKSDACCGLHSLAEIYGTLTSMRVASRRASGDQARLFIGNIRERFTLVGLDEQEYFQMLDSSAAVGIVGGAIYDAILGHCALKADAETIYTWNTKDFLRLPPVVAGRVKTPDQGGI